MKYTVVAFIGPEGARSLPREPDMTFEELYRRSGDARFVVVTEKNLAENKTYVAVIDLRNYQFSSKPPHLRPSGKAQPYTSVDHAIAATSLMYLAIERQHVGKIDVLQLIKTARFAEAYSSGPTTFK